MSDPFEDDSPRTVEPSAVPNLSVGLPEVHVFGGITSPSESTPTSTVRATLAVMAAKASADGVAAVPLIVHLPMGGAGVPAGQSMKSAISGGFAADRPAKHHAHPDLDEPGASPVGPIAGRMPSGGGIHHQAALGDTAAVAPSYTADRFDPGRRDRRESGLPAFQLSRGDYAMRPGDTWNATMQLTGAATGTPTVILLHNGVADSTVTPTVTAGSVVGQYKVSAVIPSSGYALSDSVEMFATATVSGATQSSVLVRDYIDSQRVGSILLDGSGRVTSNSVTGSVGSVAGGTAQTGDVYAYLAAMAPSRVFTTAALANSPASSGTISGSVNVSSIGGTAVALDPNNLLSVNVKDFGGATVSGASAGAIAAMVPTTPGWYSAAPTAAAVTTSVVTAMAGAPVGSVTAAVTLPATPPSGYGGGGGSSGGVGTSLPMGVATSVSGSTVTITGAALNPTSGIGLSTVSGAYTIASGEARGLLFTSGSNAGNAFAIASYVASYSTTAGGGLVTAVVGLTSGSPAAVPTGGNGILIL